MPYHFKSPVPRTPLMLCLLLVAGCVGNYLSIPLFFGANFVFGSVAVWIILHLYGAWWAVIAAAASSTVTWYLWGHPSAMIIFTLEALCVGLCRRHLRKDNILILDGLFWLAAGPPLAWLLYHYSMDFSWTLTTAVWLKQFINGVFNTLIANLIIIYLSTRRFSGQNENRRVPSLRTISFMLLLTMVLLPTILIFIQTTMAERKRFHEEMSASLKDASREITEHLRLWYGHHLTAMTQLATAAAESGLQFPRELERNTYLAKRILPDFQRIIVFDSHGKAVVVSPPFEAGDQSIANIDSSSRDYFKEVLKTGQPVLSDVFISRGTGLPVVIIAAPIFVEGRFQGLVAGTLNLERISDLLEPLGKNREMNLTLLDGAREVIARTLQVRIGDEVFSGYTGDDVSIIPQVRQRFPGGYAASLVKWQGSSYVLETRISEQIPWTVVIEAPAAPYQLQIISLHMRNLFVMAGLMLLAFPLAHLFSNWLARPLNRLTELTTNLPERLLDDQEIQWSGGVVREIQSLIVNFKSMAYALAKNFKDLRERSEELQHTSDALWTFVEACPLAIITLGMDGRIRIWNSAAERIFGWNASEVIGGPVPFLSAGEEQGFAINIDEELKDEMRSELHLRRVRKDGAPIDVALWTAPMRDSEGRMISTLGIFADITARKKDIQALRENEEKFRKIFEEGPLGMAIVSPDNRLVRVNNRLCQMLGYTEEELKTLKVKDITHEEDFQKDLHLANKAFHGEIPYYRVEKRYITKDGEIIRAHLTGTFIRDGSGTPLYGLRMIEDITEQKRAEEELKQSEQRFKGLFECAPDPYYLLDLNGKLADCNKAAEDIIGHAREALIGKSIYELNLFSPEELKLANKVLQRSELGYPSLPEEFTLNLRDRQVSLEVRTFPTMIGGQTLVLGIGRDITERKRMEEERKQIEAQLHHSQKMEAIGTLAGGIAHDFNNILSAIIGYSDLALAEMPKDDHSHYYVEQVLKSGFRAKDLVKQILEFSRQGNHEKKPLKLGAMIKETVKLLKATIPSSIDMVVNLSAPYDWILADATQVHQILMNLCTNAWQAMQENVGTLLISLEEVYADSSLLNSHPELKEGPHLKLEISDTGHGMTPDVLNRIFEPYFTTKGIGEGTGLGLAVVQGIVKNHDGSISVESKPRKGTIFRIFLPQFDRIEEEKREPVHQPLGGNETILYVDDEPAITDIGKMMLEQLGYRVVTRCSSLEALEAFRAQPDNFDIVVTDLAMPHLRGTDLAREIRKIRPGMPVILCTGFSQRMDLEKAKSAGVQEIVFKPATATELASAIRRALDGRCRTPDIANGTTIKHNRDQRR
ncbi:MAG: PAS domain S-box protein [Syntrophobacteraceae bacterium]